MTGLFDLTGKTALVTGSSGGLGLAMARGLAEAGAGIVLNGRDEPKLAAAAEALRAAGHRVRVSAFDVADEAAVVAGFAALDAGQVAIDILVNNAGIQFRKPMLELAAEDWRRVLETNLTSAFLVGRAAARRMIDRKAGGKIINIGSLTSEVARATVAPYTAAKGGLKLLTRSMAAEWARHDIQANAIGPGYIVTEMNKALVDDPSFDAWVKTRAPAGDGAARTTSSAPPCSWRRRPRPMSMDRSSTSMAECSPFSKPPARQGGWSGLSRARAAAAGGRQGRRDRICPSAILVGIRNGGIPLRDRPARLVGESNG